MKAKLFALPDVAAIVGTSAEVIRAWERQLQIRRSKGARAGEPVYRNEDIELLKEIKQAVTAHGLSLRVRARQAKERGGH